MRTNPFTLTFLAVAALVAAGAPTPTATADNVFGTDEIIIAVLDTGIRATHQEFDYGGPTDTTDQLVAWWDFTDEVTARHDPGPGELWDTHVPAPYDVQGHGTGTASMAAGLNADPGKDLSFCPGCKLAIAKVGKGNTVFLDAVARALEWAVHDVHADVISMSFGGGIQGIAPVPGAIDSVDEIIKQARDAGALPLVAAGNGHLNAGVPGHPSWAYLYGSSTEALVVGGTSKDGTGFSGAQFSWDPELTAHGFSVRTAFRSHDASYTTWSGTSFSAPQVAGMAAKLMETARAAGCDPTPDYVETLLKYVAHDHVEVPYTFEGMGFVGATEFSTANTLYAPTCTLPTRPLVDPNAAYDEYGAGTLRSLFSEVLDREGLYQWALAAPATTGPGIVGPSVPAALAEIETHELVLAAGERADVTLTYGPFTDTGGIAPDLDVYVLVPGALDDLRIEGGEVLASATRPSGVDEALTFRATAAGSYPVIVIGWAVTEDQAYTLAASNGAGALALPFVAEHVAVGTTAV